MGNTFIYLCERIDDLPKTKVMKLIYILDERSIKNSGIPFFNLKYKLWKFGAVSEEIFIDLSTETTLFKNYIERTSEEGVTIIKPIVRFNDDEFSDNDMNLLDFVIEKFGNQSAKQLVNYTHRENSPWHKTALEHSVLDLLDNEAINNTELVIGMSSLTQHDARKKLVYNDFVEAN